MNPQDWWPLALQKLDADELADLARCASPERVRYRDGAPLVRAGETDSTFFVVLEGELAVLDESSAPPRVVAVLARGDFTGEVAQLTGARSLVTIVARGECEVYAIPATRLRDIINRSPKLGDRILQAFIARRHVLREPRNFAGVRVIGSRHDKNTFRVREFLARNRIHFVSLDLEDDPEVKALLGRFGLSEAETPVVTFGDKLLLRNPSNSDLAAALGIKQPVGKRVYDLVLVGAGPAGLAAGVYGASEGLDTLIVEGGAAGGQASRSMRIENYLGFPTGITGEELAERATIQCEKFGARLVVATAVRGLRFENAYALLELDNGEVATAKCVVIASGADYRKLQADGCERFEGCGVYYAATPLEAPVCRGANAVVVGAGNSAGQAAVFLASQAKRVYVLVRGDSLYKSMSSYLARRIEETENIEVLFRTTVKRLAGDQCLRAVEIVNDAIGETRTLEAPALFSFIGAVPRTGWLPEDVEKDDKGFIRTGSAVARSPRWSSPRQPFFLETSRAGVFAVGDVRSGSIKRVASAVGEGAMAVQLVHEYLRGM